MAKTKTKSNSKHSQNRDILRSTTAPNVKSPNAQKFRRPIEDLLSEAAALLEQSQPELALPLAEEALRRLEEDRQLQQQNRKNEDENEIDTLLKLAADGTPTLPVALSLEAEIQLALGDAESARATFLRATTIDPDGALISAEPWLWLAQLSEGGGKESISHFTKASEVLRNEIEVLEEVSDDDFQAREVVNEKRSKLADALSAMAEVYMTDLSWESDAEQRCESYVTEAVAICPDHLSAGVLQTLASVRISQERLDDARQALRRSMEIWKDIPFEVESESRPDFATRVSLSRLLMEVEAETEAFIVLEGLIRADDQSIESWYLGGWCQVLKAQKSTAASEEAQKKSREQAKTWLDTCLRLYRVQQYEDERLREHAVELVQQLNRELGVEEQLGDDDAWEDEEDEDEDEDDEDLQVETNGHEDGDIEMT